MQGGRNATAAASFIHALVHSFSKYLLSVSYMPGVVRTPVNEKDLPERGESMREGKCIGKDSEPLWSSLGSSRGFRAAL